MRGGAQAHLVEADDGAFYVLKAKNNPQHRRVLVNEWLACRFLAYLQVEAPPGELVHVSPQFLAGAPDFAIQLGSRKIEIEPGWHFGSRFPGNPAEVAVFDFLPDVLLSRVENRAHFLGTLAFDKWVGNADARQAIFYRARIRRGGEEAGPSHTGFVAAMIDHGFAFNGPHWGFNDSPVEGLYFRPDVYRGVRGWNQFQPWLDRIEHFPLEVIDEAWKRIPGEWLEGDEGALEDLLNRLVQRRRRVRHLLEDAILRGRAGLFPDWCPRA